MQPLVTISIPLFKCEDFLIKCLDSVRNQTYPSIEVSLINDQTPDNSVAIAEEYIQKHTLENWRILHLNKNSGLSVVRNKGIDTAKGKYLFFLDSDDTITPDCIKALVEIAENTDAEMVVGDVESFSLPSLEKKMIFSIKEERNKIIGNKDIFKSYVDGKFLESSWNKLILVTFLRDNHLYFTPGLYAQDSLHSFHMALKLNKIAFYKETTYHYFLHENSVIHNRRKTHFDNWFTIAKQIDQALKSESNETRKKLIKRHLIHYKNMTLNMNWKAQRNKDLWKESYRNYKTLSALTLSDYFSNEFSYNLKKNNLLNSLPTGLAFIVFKWRWERTI